jgi:hypothetical protein
LPQHLLVLGHGREHVRTLLQRRHAIPLQREGCRCGWVSGCVHASQTEGELKPARGR